MRTGWRTKAERLAMRRAYQRTILGFLDSKDADRLEKARREEDMYPEMPPESSGFRGYKPAGNQVKRAVHRG